MKSVIFGSLIISAAIIFHAFSDRYDFSEPLGGYIYRFDKKLGYLCQIETYDHAVSDAASAEGGVKIVRPPSKILACNTYQTY